MVYRWYHRQFWEAAEKRYLSEEKREIPPKPIGTGIGSFTQKEARHLAIAKYFESEWESPNLIPCINTGGQREINDYLLPQSKLDAILKKGMLENIP